MGQKYEKHLSVFDDLANIAHSEEDIDPAKEIFNIMYHPDNPFARAQAVLDTCLTPTISNPFDVQDPFSEAKSIVAEMHSRQRYTTQIYERPANYEIKNSPTKAKASNGTLEGYASVWYQPDGEIYLDDYDDWVAPGSFADTIQASKHQQHTLGKDHLLPFLFNHSKDAVVGKVLDMHEDNHGVAFAAKSLNTPRGQEVYQMAADGILGVSFGYKSEKDTRATHRKSGRSYRHISKLKCFELSAVTFPANNLTTLHAKSTHSQFTVPSTYNIKPANPFAALESQAQRWKR